MKKIIFCLAVLMGVSVLAACGGPEAPYVASLNCSEGMNEYSVEGTPIQFCYDPAWGEPVVLDVEALTGSNHFVSFLNLPGPTVWYQSSDYSSVEEEDGGAVLNFSFDDLNLYTTDEGIFADVKAQYEKYYNFSDDNLDVRKSDIGGVRAARVHAKYTYKSGNGSADTVTYYVPNAWEGYHMTVTADYLMAEELDDFVYDMIL